MPQIKLLPENLINQIAAGEVVERPASVVKELIENALDAGTKRLIIEIEGGGDTFIRITDDGIGMDKEDALMAFERHATSKIQQTDDLFNIHTLGFRGEALASIASVSQMKLQTKKRGDVEGTIVHFEGGVKKEVKTAGVPEGTQIEVKNLFYNTPARKKYLKTAGTEFGHIVDTICGVALAFPEVAFKLIRDRKIVFDFPASEDFLLRIRAVLGKELSENLVPVFNGHSEIQLEGFIGKPSIARNSRKDQYLFVNRRLVKSNSLSYAVRQSYYSLLPKEKQPVFLLYLNVTPELVDVNVHPRKLEVRFKDEKELFKVISQASLKALEKHVLAPKMNGNEEASLLTYQHGRVHQNPYRLQDAGLKNDISQQKAGAFQNNLADQKSYSVDEALVFTQTISIPRGTDDEKMNNETAPSNSQNFPGGEDIELPFDQKLSSENSQTVEPAQNSQPLERILEGELVPLAQLDNAYILCQQMLQARGHAGLSVGALVIVDQHAAHERIRYTQLVADFEAQKKVSQPLLVPLQLEFSFQEISLLQENLEILQQLGFEMESFGGKTFSVFAVPSYLVEHDITTAINGLIDDFAKGLGKGDFQKRKERALTYMACRSAVKFGDKLGQEEQLALVKKLQTIPLAYTCPHGRPTMVVVGFEELQRRFGRK